MKSEPYECGLPSEVSRTFRFGVSFYMIAMLFILFDIEVVFLYPVGAILTPPNRVFVLVESGSSSPCCWSRSLRVAKEGAELEIERTKLRALSPLEEPRSPDELRVRQMKARDMLRGDLEGPASTSTSNRS